MPPLSLCLRGLAPVLLAAVLAAPVIPAQAGEVTFDTLHGPVQIAETPERVISFDFGIIDTMIALGVKPIAVPTPNYVAFLDGDLAGIPSAGTLFEPDFEKIFSMKPDLVILEPRTAAKFDQMKKIAPTIDLPDGGDRLVATVETQTTQLGQLFDRQDRAAALVTRLQDKIAKLKGLAADAGTAMILMTNGPKISAYGPGSRFGWMHDDLGLKPAAADLEVALHGQPVSFEYILKADPDWIIVIDRSAAISGGSEQSRATLDNDLVRQTKAWKNDHVIYLDPAPVYVSATGIQSMTRTVDELTRALSGAPS